MTITIKPLEKESLADAIALGQRVFDKDDPARIAFWLENSLNPDKEAVLKEQGATYIQFWIAEENNRVVGGVGYYVRHEDIDEAAWLGWFFVDPQYRGKKIGLQLLETVINAVKKTGKPYLRVYFTSNSPLEKRAQRIYEQRDLFRFETPLSIPFKKKWLYIYSLILRKKIKPDLGNFCDVFLKSLSPYFLI